MSHQVDYAIKAQALKIFRDQSAALVSALIQFMADNSLSDKECANLFDMGSKALSNFLQGKSLLSAKSLNKILVYCEQHQVKQVKPVVKQLLRQVELGKLADRDSSLAACSDHIIDMACQIRQTYNHYTGKECRVRDFAGLFGQQSEIIEQFLVNGNVNQLAELDSEAVEKTLTDPNIEDNIRKIFQQRQHAIIQLRQQLQTAVIAAEKRGQTIEQQAVACQIISTTLTSCLSGSDRSSERNMQQWLEIISGLPEVEAKPKQPTAKPNLKTVQAEASQANQLDLPTAIQNFQAATKTLVAGLESLLKDTPQVMGNQLPITKSDLEVSQRGVRSVLTAKNFEPVEGQIDNRTINETLEIIRELRSRFNLFSQLADAQAKARVKKQLETEIEELFIAMRILSTEIAPNLLDLFDSQRQAFESFNGGGK